MMNKQETELGKKHSCCVWNRHIGLQRTLLGLEIFSLVTTLLALATFSYTNFCAGTPVRDFFQWWEDAPLITDSTKCTALFTAIGLTGSIAWLVPASDRKVLGVPIGHLLRWAHPYILISHFYVFLPTILWGILAGNSGASGATAFALLGAIIQFEHLMYVNNQLLLSPDLREQIVYAYYMYKLENCSDDIHFSPPAILHMTAECSRALLMEEMRINSAETLELWHQAVYQMLNQNREKIVRGQTGQAQPLQSTYSAEERKVILSYLQTQEKNGQEAPDWLLKAADVWYILLRAPISATQKESAIQKMLYRLANKSDADIFTYMALMAGLILAVFRLHEQSQEAVKRIWSDIHLILGPLKENAPDGLLLLPSEKNDGPVFRYEPTKGQRKYLAEGFGAAAGLFQSINKRDRSRKRDFSLLEQYRKFYADEILQAPIPEMPPPIVADAVTLATPISPIDIYGTTQKNQHRRSAGMDQFARLCVFQTGKAEPADIQFVQRELLLWLVEWGYRTEHAISYTKFLDDCGKAATQISTHDHTVDENLYFRISYIRNIMRRGKQNDR